MNDKSPWFSEQSTAESPLDPNLLKLLAAVQKMRGASTPGESPEKMRAAIRRVLALSLAKDARGARLRAAWLRMASTALEILRELSGETDGQC